MPSLSTINYFLPPRGYFWAWSDDSAADWEDGTTLAVWAEIDTILTEIADEGLPPLGSILLILSACGNSWPQRWSHVYRLAGASTGENEPLATTRRLLMPVQDGLDKIHRLPIDLRRGARARCALVSAIFEGVFNRLPSSVAETIMREVHREGLGFRRAERPDLGINTRLLRDLSALDAAFSRLDLSKLEARLRTGIDAEFAEQIELPLEPDSAREDLPLLEQLASERDQELSSLATLARRVIAALNIPRLPGQRQDLPVGGLSDISNRGDLTRLLLGELAWDEEMFAARLAHAEALYYRREVPPDAPQSLRVILLDHGIRLWGLPRIYAFATALGLQAQGLAQGNAGVQVFRREDLRFEALPLATVADARLHLEALSPHLTPVDALAAWSPGIDQKQQRDIFFITVTETLAAPETMTALHQLCARAGAGSRLFTVGVDRDGRIELGLCSLAGHRLLGQCRLDLDAILPTRKEASAQGVPKISLRLYALNERITRLAFYNHWPLPMEFNAVPHPGQYFNRAWKGRTLAVDTENRLMAWTAIDANGPAVELSAGLPAAREYWVDPVPHGFLSVICSANDPGERVKLCRQKTAAEPPEIVELASRHSFPRMVTFSSGAAILHYAAGAEAFSLATGLRVAEITFPDGVDSPTVSFDGDRLNLSAESPNPLSLPSRDRAKIADVRTSLSEAPRAIGLAEGELAIAFQHHLRIWSQEALRFVRSKEGKQRMKLTGETPFTRVPGASFAGNSIPAFFHAKNAAAEFIYDTRGILVIPTADVEAALPVFSSVARGMWSSPPNCADLALTEVREQLEVLAALERQR